MKLRSPKTLMIAGNPIDCANSPPRNGTETTIFEFLITLCNLKFSYQANKPSSRLFVELRTRCHSLMQRNQKLPMNHH